MIKFYDGTVDSRPTLETKGFTYCSALQLNPDGTKQWVFYKDLDDVRYESADATIDATPEVLEQYRRARREFASGDVVKVNRGRKMVGEVKTIKFLSTYRPQGTYGWSDLEYLHFTDGTKVASTHVDFI